MPKDNAYELGYHTIKQSAKMDNLQIFFLPHKPFEWCGPTFT